MIFTDVLIKQRDRINLELEKYLSGHVPSVGFSDISLFYDMIKGYTLSGGKRLRPISMILAYNASGKNDDRILLPALAIELHHTYSLILDDIMDEDDFRRHKPTVYKRLKEYFLKNFDDGSYEGSLFSKKSSRFSASFAMMLGNLTNIFSKRLIIDSEFDSDKKLKALNIIEKADEEIYRGQMLDLLMEDKKTNETEYLEMIRLKTSVLFGVAFELGSLFAGSNEYLQHMFRDFGIKSAISFQIQDDIIDILGDKGHEKGSDIKKGKMTLLMIKAQENADEHGKKIIRDVFGNSRADSNGVNRLIKLMHDTGAIDYAKRIALSNNNEAKHILAGLDIDSHYKQIFLGYTDFLFQRSS